jgi:hypothetical protein
MKRILLTFIVALFVVPVFAQAPAATGKKADEFVKFKETKYNFGKIPQGTPVTHDFAFTNITGSNVIIETATASCGCTTPKWPQAPIGKGATDKITAGFNAASAGPFSKEIYVRVKGADTPFALTITGEVVAKEQ